MSLDGHYDTDNIFAHILQKKIPAVIVHENKDCLAFMDAFPQSRGHTLIIPKHPSRNLLDADSRTLIPLIHCTQKLARAIQAALQPDGLIITQFNGADAGQTVFHLHFHIIPRYKNQPQRPHSSAQADRSKLEQLAERIKTQL